MASVGDTLAHCTGTGTQADPYIFNSPEGFMEAIVVRDAYVEASTTSMEFDCNNCGDVITAPLAFLCRYFDGKGLTILNLLIQGVDNTSFIRCGYNDPNSTVITNPNHDYVLKNINFYNFCALISEQTVSLMSTVRFSAYPCYYFNMINCNFAGIYVGYPKWNSRTNIIQPPSAGTNDYGFQYKFDKCTFNIHFKAPAISDSRCTFVFAPYTSEWQQTAAFFNNCTVCLSGTVPFTVNLCGILSGSSDVRYGNSSWNSCTFVNSRTNPLNCANYLAMIRISGSSGYNYYKMTINPSSNIYINDTYGLINMSRIGQASSANSITGIKMQEDDPTASDYIYNDENLANAGFLVGQVIE